MSVRRIVAALFASFVTVMSVSVSVQAQTISGDANGDGVVNVRDAAYIASSIVHRKDLDDAADYNRDGEKNIRDAAAIAADLLSGSTGATAYNEADFPDHANAILKLVNNERARLGVKPLRLDATLCGMAEDRAAEICTEFGHTRPDGSECLSIFEQYGEEYTCAGENIAGGCTTPLEVFIAWKDSPEHYANMVDPTFTELGVGYYNDEGSAYVDNWVQIFRRP